MKSLFLGKVLGFDGVFIEFFKIFLDEIGFNFFDFIKEIFVFKFLCRVLNISKIRFLLKN